MIRMLTLVAAASVIIAGCGGGAIASPVPSVSHVPTPTAAPSHGPTPTAAPSPSATASASPTQANSPAGRILFHREGSDGIERYFTTNTDGTNEQALFTAEGCECAHWSADRTHVLTLAATGLGTWSFTTMRPDGSDKVVTTPSIKTLNLAPGASTLDGSRIAFNGWDERDPSNTGLYLGAPGLTDLRRVLPLQEGWLAIEPFGITADGSRIAFFADTGPEGGITHAGDLYAVSADGSGLRQLNPSGGKVGFMGMPAVSLSPPYGRRAAFAVDDAVYVIDLDRGKARRITKGNGFVWAVQWSPTGEWISYTRFHGATSVIELVRPDGTDQKAISRVDEGDEANAAVWSPEGDYLLVPRDSDRSVDGPQDLWIMGLDGAWISQVTHEPSKYGTYSWALAAGS